MLSLPRCHLRRSWAAIVVFSARTLHFKKTDFDRNLSRSLYFTSRKIFARAHKRNSGLGYGIAINIVFFTVTDVIFLTKSMYHGMTNDSSHLSHAV